MRNFLPLVAITQMAICISGCSGVHYKTVHFDSDPQGQRVFLAYTANIGNKLENKQFLGTTPCTNAVLVDRHDEILIEQGRIAFYSGFVQPCAVFSCEPSFSETNLHRQTIVLRGEAHWREADIVPSSLFFDLHKQE